MAASSAGLLMFRRGGAGVEVLLAHPGGPFWARKDEGAWTLPKGEYHPGEEPLAAARREFTEETGFTSTPPFIPLGVVKMKSGKTVQGWAFEGDCDPAALVSNTFEVEWPARSGRTQLHPEVDRCGWFGLAQAAQRIHPAQLPFLSRLADALA